MDVETMKKLDELVKNLKKLFADDDNFKKDPERPIDYYADSNEVSFPIEDLLIDNGGQPNWVNIAYVEKEGDFWIHAGDKDSFGWLTGVIEPNKQEADKYKMLVYG